MSLPSRRLLTLSPRIRLKRLRLLGLWHRVLQLLNPLRREFPLVQQIVIRRLLYRRRLPIRRMYHLRLHSPPLHRHLVVPGHPLISHVLLQVCHRLLVLLLGDGGVVVLALEDVLLGDDV